MTEPSTTTTVPLVTSTNLAAGGPLRGSANDLVGATEVSVRGEGPAARDPEAEAGYADPADPTDTDTGTADNQAPERGEAGSVVTDGAVPVDETPVITPPVVSDGGDQNKGESTADPETPAAPAADDTPDHGTADVPDTVGAEPATTTTVPAVTTTTVPDGSMETDRDLGSVLTGWVRDNLGTIAWTSSLLPRSSGRRRPAVRSLNRT